MREVEFDLPLRNPEGAREPTSIPRMNPEQCDDLLSQCRFAAYHRSSSLHAHQLVELVHHLNHILLVAHDLIHILVSLRQFVKHRAVLAALDTESLRDQVCVLEAVARLSTAHAASGAVRTRMQGRWVALTTDDERAGSHRAWHDAIFSHSCRDSAFASHPHVLPEVFLLLAIVVVAINADKARHRVQKACVFEDVLGDIEYRKYKATFHGTPASASQQPASAHPAPPGALPRRTGAPEASQPCRQQARRPTLQGTDRTGAG